eukprot:scaffold111029_cov70-Phaeocystis_antarctica.AAC.2
MEAGGSRAALKRARKKQSEARPPHPERRDPQPTAASSDQVVGKRRDKRKDKRAAKRITSFDSCVRRHLVRGRHLVLPITPYVQLLQPCSCFTGRGPLARAGALR